jgi:hypothetical protein
VDTEAASGGTPGEIQGLYDHSIRRHPRLGLALIASLFVLGGGQLVRGEPKRVILLWLAALLGTASAIAHFVLLHPGAPTDDVVSGGWHFWYSVVKIYGIFDTMRAGPRVAPEREPALASAPAATIGD